MKYILIDTCVLEALINDVADDWSLAPLYEWVNSEQLQFLAPPTLIAEWNEHKTKKTGVINKRVRENRKQRDINEDLGIFDEEKDLSPGEKRILRQVEKLEAIISSSPTIEKYTEVLVLIDELKEKKRPPFFHTEVKDSEKDAKIIFTTLEYAKRNGISELLLVSKNKAEFASKDVPGQMHFGIHQKYPEVRVQFYENPLKVVEYLKQHGLTLRPPKIKKEKEAITYISVDHSKNILDQLHSFLAARFKNWNYLPKRFLVNQYPFVLGKQALECQSINGFRTNNPSLFKFLQSVKIVDNQYVSTADLKDVENSNLKITEVFQWLRAANIRKVVHDRSGDFNLPFIKSTVGCECYGCRWNNCGYTEILKDLNRTETELSDKIDQAYAGYELSEYCKSIDILIEAAVQANDQKNYVLLFVCQYNIRLLKQQHNHTKFGVQFPDPLETVDAFDIEETILLMSKADQEIARWLEDGSIYDEYSLTLLEDGEELRKALRKDKEYSVHKFNDIMDSFYDVWRFLSDNRIVGDQLSDFTHIYQIFQEELFMMLAINKYKKMDRVQLQDHHLRLIAKYGRYQDIRELIAEYKIGVVPTFENVGVQIVSHFSCLVDEMTRYPQEELFNQGPHYFRGQVKKMIDVYALLSQYIDLTAAQINEMARKIAEYSRLPEVQDNQRLSSAIHQFLIQQSAVIDTQILTDFLIQYIQTHQLLDFYVAEMLLTSLEKRNITLLFSLNTWNIFPELISRFLSQDDTDTFSNLLRFIKLSNDSEKISNINKFLEKSLADVFVGNAFCMARTLGYLKNNEFLFQQYVSFMEEHLSGITNKHDWSQTYRYGTDVIADQYLNLHFKENFNIPDKISTTLKKRSAYYRWLLDLDGYDYLEFEPEWVWHAFTIYYQRHLKESVSLRKRLHKVFSETKREDIGRLLIKLYIYDD